MPKKSKNRIVVNDLQTTNPNPPPIPSGTRTASNPSLRTSVPGGTANSNSILSSFAGFNKSIQQIGIAREKNAAADEAVEARNAALAGQFRPFDRQESVDLYDKTTGDIKGVDAAIRIQPDLDAGTADLLNQNLSLDQTLKGFDDLKRQLITQQFGPEGSGDIVDRSEAYKSGFIPHIIKQVETARTKLAQQHTAKFNAERSATLSSLADNVADETISEETIDENGVILSKTAPSLGSVEFAFIRDKGVAMGMTREEATTDTIQTLVAKAVEEGRPELLDFGKQKLSDGTILENNKAYNKTLDEGRKAATATYIAGEKLKIAKAKRELTAKRDALGASTVNYIVEHAGQDNTKLLNSVAAQKILKPSTMTSLFAFNKTMAEGDGDIAFDSEAEISLMAKIANDELTTVDQLKTEWLNSKERGKGINRPSFLRLKSALETQLGNSEAVNAYKMNLNRIKAIVPTDDVALFSLVGKSKGNGKTFSYEDVLNRKGLAADLLLQYEEGALIFQNTHPGKSLSSPEAVEFFEKHRQAIIDASVFQKPADEPDEQIADKVQTGLIGEDFFKDAHELELFGKWRTGIETNIKDKIDAEKYLQSIRKYLTNGR